MCSIKPLSDSRNGSFGSIESIFSGAFTLCVASDYGMRLVHSCMVEVLNSHVKDLTWNGEFSLNDTVVVNGNECRIIKKPVPGESHHRAKDLHRIGEIFMPMFKYNGQMALYFA